MLLWAIDFILSPAATRICLGPFLVILRFLRRKRGVPKRLLIVKLDRIGDLVLTVPLLRELRANLPNARITLIVAPGIVSFMSKCPYVDEVLSYQKGSFRGGRSELRNRWQTILFAVRELWPRRFDTAVSLRRDWDQDGAALVCYLSGAIRRIGFTENASVEKSIHNRGWDSWFTEVLPAMDAHEVQSNLSVLRHLGFVPANDCLELWADADDQAWADRHLADIPAGTRLIAICTGGSHIVKKWPVERFIEVLDHLFATPNTRVIVLGGSDDVTAAEEIRCRFAGRVIDLAGKASVLQSFAVLQRCHLYVGNDTGPMHLAAAAGVPVIEICMYPKSLGTWNSNSPHRFGPYGVPSVILQPEVPTAPCLLSCIAIESHCILGVTVGAVLKAIPEVFTIRIEDPQSVSACPPC